MLPRSAPARERAQGSDQWVPTFLEWLPFDLFAESRYRAVWPGGGPSMKSRVLLAGWVGLLVLAGCENKQAISMQAGGNTGNSGRLSGGSSGGTVNSVSDSGGTSAAGETSGSNVAGSSGGATVSSVASSPGGATASAGGTGDGGATAFGGATSQAGATAFGGTASGGATDSGASTESGGTTGSGGRSGRGGAISQSTSGSSSGTGTGTGGTKSTGGSATGGSTGTATGGIKGAGGSSTSTKNPLDLVPLDNEVPGWIVDVTRTMDPNQRAMTATTFTGAMSLIDGAAENYFQGPNIPKMFLWQNYVNPDLSAPDESYVKLYIFVMPSTEQAKGLYAAVLRNAAYTRTTGLPRGDWQPTTPTVGTESRIVNTGTQWWINFYSDVFYVEVVLDPSYGPPPDYLIDNADTERAALRFAQAIASRI
jgi:hypothetical protein